MEQSKVEEGNRLIAEFMGLEKHESEDAFIVTREFCQGMIGFFSPNQLYFHQSWDWLMPVVEKIESMREGYIWSDPWGHVKISIWTKGSSNHYTKTNITIIEKNKKEPLKAFYNACVKFIKWYNDHCEPCNPLDYTPTPEESPYLYKRKEIHV